ncbi:hypothetical protein IJS18_01160 [Candidatus Saccharibacteria bacterium]|nr:hypothetical protein [Candidatus Saccharibacteria bacterium]
MDLVIRENIVILTSEKWVDKHRLATKIKEAVGPKKCTVVHYDELRRQTIAMLGERYSEAKALARFTEALARNISTAFMCDSLLILDTDISTVHDMKGLIRLIGYVYNQTNDWYEEQRRFMSPKDKDFKRITKHLEEGPPSILHLKVLADEARQQKGITHFYMAVRDELYNGLGDEGLVLNQILETEDLEKLEHERVKYAGLLFYENCTSRFSIHDVRIENEDDVTITLDL